MKAIKLEMSWQAHHFFLQLLYLSKFWMKPWNHIWSFSAHFLFFFIWYFGVMIFETRCPICWINFLIWMGDFANSCFESLNWISWFKYLQPRQRRKTDTLQFHQSDETGVKPPLLSGRGMNPSILCWVWFSLHPDQVIPSEYGGFCSIVAMLKSIISSKDPLLGWIEI